MPPAKEHSRKKGQKVETVHGEKLTVLEVGRFPDVTKKGQVVREGEEYVIAESGGHRTLFRTPKLK